MGGSLQDIGKAWGGVASRAFKNFGNASAMFDDSQNLLYQVNDPSGSFGTASTKEFRDLQEAGDVLGYGAKPAAEARAAEAAAAKQQSLIDQQNAKVEAERKKQQSVADERSNRMRQNQLLSGAETGISSSLLG